MRDLRSPLLIAPDQVAHIVAPARSALQTALESVPLHAMSPEDEALRYAGIVMAWNVFQHVYPYFDVVAADWDEVLARALLRTEFDRTSRDYLMTLRWMVAQLEDGHGNVTHPETAQEAGLPLQLSLVEDRVVVTALAGAASPVCARVGDIVSALDGVAIEKWLRESQRYISGSPQWKVFRALQVEFARGPRGSPASLTLDRDGHEVSCDIERNHTGLVREVRPEPVVEIEPGIYYVDLDRADMPSIAQAAERLAAARGIVFDLRGYPNSNHAVLQHLTDGTLRSAHWLVPEQILPDREGMLQFDTSGRWTLEPRAPRFPDRIAFLIDARAISYAESVMGIVEHYRLGEIVGQPTAGANGNVNSFMLPGGYRIPWTGMRVIKHDGSQHHLVGIQPTVPVERTLDGVRAGRDEVLEAALEIVR